MCIRDRDTHEENYLETREGKLLPVQHCLRGSSGWALYGKTAQALADCGARGIDKSAFGIDCGDPAVLAVLPERADRIELVGLVSNICVVDVYKRQVMDHINRLNGMFHGNSPFTIPCVRRR